MYVCVHVCACVCVCTGVFVTSSTVWHSSLLYFLYAVLRSVVTTETP